MLKKQQWLILPTKNDGKEWGAMWINIKEELRFSSENSFNPFYQIFHNAYILSDEEIKEGDWVVNKNDKVFIYTKDSVSAKEYCQKIIASSDKTLHYTEEYLGKTLGKFTNFNVPQIRENVVKASIEDYNKGKKWEWVNVEYKELDECEETVDNQGNITGRYIQQLKLRPDNTVIIYPIQETFTREEVIEILVRKTDFPNTLDTIEELKKKFTNTWGIAVASAKMWLNKYY